MRKASVMTEEIRSNGKFGVYAIHVVENGINYVYVGSGNLADRISGNQSKLKRSKHANKQLQQVYNRIGYVLSEILEFVGHSEEDRQYSRELETRWIEHFKGLDGVIVCNTRVVSKSKPYAYQLTEESVRTIKMMIANGLKNKEISKQTGVSEMNVSRIRTGIRWGHIMI